MITSYNEREYEFKGLSTDIKPVSQGDIIISNGSIFIEMDTSKVYMYNGADNIWVELK